MHAFATWAGRNVWSCLKLRTARTRLPFEGIVVEARAQRSFVPPHPVDDPVLMSDFSLKGESQLVRTVLRIKPKLTLSELELGTRWP